MSKFEPKICNWCGYSCAMALTSDGEVCENEGLIDATVIGGYPSTPGNGSGALDDSVYYKFSLCEFCLDYMFSNFKIPPHVEELGKSDEIKFVPAATRVNRDEWRTQKEEFFIRKFERDKARKLKGYK